MESVYLETTIIGHLMGRLHPDPVIAGRQVTTREWWQSASSLYKLYVSQLVIRECSDGDAGAAKERLDAISGIDLLEISTEADFLADQLIKQHAVPITEPRDALHIAIAATGAVEFLVTWNFRHIANPSMRKRIEAVCRDHGFEPPLICTPDEILGVDDGTR